jgi:hypothetical protein
MFCLTEFLVSFDKRLSAKWYYAFRNKKYREGLRLKKVVVLALMLIVALGGTVMASDVINSDEIQFKLNVLPWMEIECSEPPTLEIAEGQLVGESISTVTVTSNTDFSIRFTSEKLGNIVDNYFRFRYAWEGGSGGIRHVPGGSASWAKIGKGVQKFTVEFFPRTDRDPVYEWYKLPTGEHIYKVIVTVSAADA